MTRKTPTLAALATGIAACTPQQLADAQRYQADIAAACAVAMQIGAATPAGPWIVASCATEQSIAALALDPSSLAWLNGIIARLQQRA